MKVNVISRKLIKPYTPTPQNLKKYKISLTEELMPPMNVSVILFYPPNPNPKTTISHLEETLAKILPQFYPLAGRYIKKDHLVDCNDEGAEFVEAESADIELIDLIAKTKNDQLNYLLSRQTYDVDKTTDPLLSVQITKFKCGGLAISVSMSHRISDASSLETFIAAWTNADNHPAAIIPSFDSPSLFPGINLEYDLEPPRNTVVIKRLLFNKEAISSLRSKLRPNNNGRGFFSRVRLVSAFIAKALIGVEIAKYGESRDCIIAQAVNVRERTIPPLPKHSCGNLVVQALTHCMAANEEMGFQELVNTLGDSIDKTVNDCGELMSLGEDGRIKFILDPVMNFVKRLESGEMNAVWFTDWSKFGFYDADFGWGKPVWVGIGSVPSQNLTLLMNNKEGDGIEAWVHLNPVDVPYFEQNEDMNLFIIA